MKENSVEMINSEVGLATQAVKDWVEIRLSDSATLLQVPGVIGVGEKKCEFKSFTDFTKAV